MKDKIKKLIKPLIIIVILLAIGLGIFFYFQKSKKPAGPIEKGKVMMGSIVNSVSADGVVEPVTNIEIKSNVSGTILNLYADEGDYVKAGQLLAKIDPVDVLTTLEKEQNNVKSAEAQLESAIKSLEMQRTQSSSDIITATENVNSARLKLKVAQDESKAQPTISNNEIATAKSNLAQAKQAVQKLQNATNNQSLRNAQSSYDQALAAYNVAKNTVDRNRALYKKGYLSKKDFETSEEQFISSEANLASAKTKLDTVKSELSADLVTAKEKVKSCELALKTAQANVYNVDVKKNNVKSAESSLKSAQESLKLAEANVKQIQVKEASVAQARANLDSAKSSLENAKKNYDYTFIKAPRDGVLVKKWTDEGAIVQSGRNSMSSNSEGVVIFELADTTKMQVSVDVDETDVYNIVKGQVVNVSVDAYPDKKYTGVVSRISASAETNSGVTTVPVEVVLDGNNQELKPEMNATCEFIVDTKDNILTLNTDYCEVKGDIGTTFVMGEDGKPKPIEFKVGIIGEESVEVIDKLKEGQEVIAPRSAEIMMGKGAPKDGKNTRRMGPPPM
ncbi:MAG: HlyD family efflux transporter periplasmic adaptor subunit [Abditibacteriota bacterium]|nr:HlyD family efflux transporter periplasmic adaptor subunit [Abditibacteriota bacterium]